MKIGLMVVAAAVLSVASGWAEDMPKVRRESTEWCTFWFANANKTDKPRVLMVGDSITNGYAGGVEKAVAEKAYCAKLTTSACVADPVFPKQLESVLMGYAFNVIHFNNGLHGTEYTEAEYKAGYEKALELIRQLQPKSRLILVLSTPLKSGSPADGMNPRIDERNRIVSELAGKFGAEVNDLHSISKGHPEYYTDPYHYKPEAIKLQAERVSQKVLAVLEK